MLSADSVQNSLPVTDVKIQVHRLVPEKYDAWDEFVKSCAKATFFHLSGWQTVIEKSFGHTTFFLYAEAAGNIVGVLPLAQIKSKLFGHSLSSLPFCVYGGIAAQSSQASNSLDAAAQELAVSLRVDHLEYRNYSPIHADWPTKDLYVTFRKRLEADVEKNMLAIPRKQRAMVRKGIKAGLTSELEADTERFFPIYADSVHRLGTPVFSRKYFRILKETFGSDCEILTVNLKGKAIASVLTFYFRDEVLPYYGGGTADAREVAGFDFMYWELMRRSTERGYQIFDYGRSKRGTGSFDFKKNWGFEAQPLFYEYKLYAGKNLPDHNPLNPKYRLFIKAWQKLPLGVANFIGPHIVKNLG